MKNFDSSEFDPLFASSMNGDGLPEWIDSDSELTDAIEESGFQTRFGVPWGHGGRVGPWGHGTRNDQWTWHHEYMSKLPVAEREWLVRLCSTYFWLTFTWQDAASLLHFGIGDWPSWEDILGSDDLYEPDEQDLKYDEDLCIENSLYIQRECEECREMDMGYRSDYDEYDNYENSNEYFLIIEEMLEIDDDAESDDDKF